MKFFRRFLLAGFVFVQIVPAICENKSAEAEWKEHRDAGRDALKNGKHDLAAREFEQALKASETFEPQDIRHVEALSELADVYISMRRYEEAEPLCERALGLRHNVVSRISLEVELHLRLQLCEVYKYEGKLPKAELMLLDTQKSMEKRLGKFHPALSRVLLSLGNVYLHEKEYSKAESTLKKALKIAEAALTARYRVSPGIQLQIDLANEAHLATIFNALGLAYSKSNNFPAAEKYFLKAIKNTESNDSKTSAALTSPLLNLAILYLQRGDYTKAEISLERTRKIAEQHCEPGHPFFRDLEETEAELIRLRKFRKVI